MHKIGLIKYFNLTGKKQINNSRYKIPVLGKVGYHNLFDWEPWMITLIKKFELTDQSLFVDVGVNIGQSLLKVKSINPGIKYIGFEPNPTCTNYVELLIKSNDIKNAVVVPVGLSTNNEINELNLFNDLSSDGAASIVKDIRPGNKIFGTKYVPIFNLQTIKTNLDFDNLSILKVDVEGAEYEVLSEFRKDISKYKPAILIEILPVYSPDMKERLVRQQKIEALLSELEYSIFKIEFNTIELIAIKEMSTIGIHNDINECDYVFIHKSNRQKFFADFKQWLT